MNDNQIVLTVEELSSIIWTFADEGREYDTTPEVENVLLRAGLIKQYNHDTEPSWIIWMIENLIDEGTYIVLPPRKDSK